MRHDVRSIAVLAYLCVVVCCGLVVFLAGFLLRRSVIERRSECSPELCHLPAIYRRAVVLVVDGLRHDFLDFNESLPAPLPFQNRMPFVHRLLSDGGRESGAWAARYRLLADPPTTTLQRLKALGTGALPTFSDAASNFGGDAVLEDSWLLHAARPCCVEQAAAAPAGLIMAGDDTWLRLFPAVFHVDRSRALPSFNVRDLDSVDEAVAAFLAVELRRPSQQRDWRVLLAHSLGVDHCGHTHGTLHPLFSRKLSLVDSLIKNITGQLDNDTVLIVLGDHGMTSSGEHGGDSVEEVSAGMLVVSTRQPRSSTPTPGVPSVWQVDVVPTLSALLALPIPYSNTGAVLHQLLPEWRRSAAVSANTRQVARLMRHYDFVLPAAPPANASITDHHSYLRHVRLACVEQWATFSVWRMIVGVLIMSVGGCAIFVFSRLIVTTASQSSQSAVASSPVHLRAGGLMMAVLSALWWFWWTSYGSWLLTAVILAPLCFMIATHCRPALLMRWLRSQVPQSQGPVHSAGATVVVSVAAVLCLLLQCVALFSNSFVVNDDTVCLFLLVSLLLVATYVTQWWRAATRLSVVAGVVACVAARVGRLFGECREEQRHQQRHHCRHQWQRDSLADWRRPLLSLLPSSVAAVRVVVGRRVCVSVVCVLSVVVLQRRILRYCGCLNGHAPAQLAARWLLPLSATTLYVSWLVQMLPDGQLAALHVAGWRVCMSAAVSVCAAAVVYVVVVWRPLLVFVSVSQQAHRPLLSRLFLHESRSVVVYGLAAAVTAPLLCLLTAVWLLTQLTLGEGLAAPSTLTLVVLTGAVVTVTPLHHTDSACYRWLVSVLCSVLCGHHFYSTSHQATFPAIQWQAAFSTLMPVDGAVQATDSWLWVLIASVGVLANTFSGELLTAVCLPAALVTPTLVQYLRGRDSRGEMQLLLRADCTCRSLLSLHSVYLCVRCVKLVCACVSVCVLRRHLMLWKVFAPRLVFEAAAFVVCVCATLVSLCVCTRIVRRAAVWLNRLASRDLL